MIHIFLMSKVPTMPSRPHIQQGLRSLLNLLPSKTRRHFRPPFPNSNKTCRLSFASRWKDSTCAIGRAAEVVPCGSRGRCRRPWKEVLRHIFRSWPCLGKSNGDAPLREAFASTWRGTLLYLARLALAPYVALPLSEECFREKERQDRRRKHGCA